MQACHPTTQEEDHELSAGQLSKAVSKWKARVAVHGQSLIVLA